MSKGYCELCFCQRDKSFLYVIEVDEKKIYLCEQCVRKIKDADYAEDTDESE